MGHNWKCISALINNNVIRRGLYVSATRENSIKALAFWVIYSLRIGRVKLEADFDETEFTTIKMTEMVDEAYIRYVDWNTNSDVSTTSHVSYNKWDIW